jgi:hypothetical protein
MKFSLTSPHWTLGRERKRKHNELITMEAATFYVAARDENGLLQEVAKSDRPPRLPQQLMERLMTL